MKNILKKFLLVFCSFYLCWQAEALAWDGEREGFILGIGFGSGRVSFVQDYLVEDLAREPDFTRNGKIPFTFSCRTGYAPNNKLLVHVSLKNVLFKNKSKKNEKFTFLNSIFSIGWSHYLIKELPQAFLTGGIGISTLLTKKRSSPITIDNGFSFLGGFGYEISKYVIIEGDIVFGHPNIRTLMLSFEILGY